MYSAASSSADPPISPIIITAWVPGSASKASRQSMNDVPGTGSPPMPTQVETPMSLSLSSYSAWEGGGPDRLTMPTVVSPSTGALAMWPAVMPMLARPGLMMPGQLGPSSCTSGKSRLSSLKNQASPWAGTPSVRHTTNDTPPSAASITAPRTPGAGMKMQLAVAPVA